MKALFKDGIRACQTPSGYLIPIPNKTIRIFKKWESNGFEFLLECILNEKSANPFTIDFLELDNEQFFNKYGVTQENLLFAASNNFTENEVGTGYSNIAFTVRTGTTTPNLHSNPN